MLLGGNRQGADLAAVHRGFFQGHAYRAGHGFQPVRRVLLAASVAAFRRRCAALPRPSVRPLPASSSSALLPWVPQSMPRNNPCMRPSGVIRRVPGAGFR